MATIEPNDARVAQMLQDYNAVLAVAVEFAKKHNAHITTLLVTHSTDGDDMFCTSSLVTPSQALSVGMCDEYSQEAQIAKRTAPAVSRSALEVLNMGASLNEWLHMIANTARETRSLPDEAQQRMLAAAMDKIVADTPSPQRQVRAMLSGYGFTQELTDVVAAALLTAMTAAVADDAENVNITLGELREAVRSVNAMQTFTRIDDVEPELLPLLSAEIEASFPGLPDTYQLIRIDGEHTLN